MSPDDVLTFWRDAGPDRWFSKDETFDATIRARFLPYYEAAARGGLDRWTSQPDGALALLILLDQFPRNIFRGQKRAFAADSLARAVAATALASGYDRRCETVLRQFFYLPFMHSERLDDQDRCLRLYENMGDEALLKYAREHRSIIARFGRFPHRNALLGRQSSAEEQAFLDSGGFGG
ncbi:MAG TPA: DUF924 family protein [Beijerinckiaceae bacterium]|nr:DUF924 family protein [Beijerinckiaceae bacterium]